MITKLNLNQQLLSYQTGEIKDPNGYVNKHYNFCSWKCPETELLRRSQILFSYLKQLTDTKRFKFSNVYAEFFNYNSINDNETFDTIQLSRVEDDELCIILSFKSPKLIEVYTTQAMLPVSTGSWKQVKEFFLS